MVDHNIKTVSEALDKVSAHLEWTGVRILGSVLKCILEAKACLSALEERVLPELPEGYRFSYFYGGGAKYVCILNDMYGRGEPRGEGPTPRAAVLAAIAKIEGDKNG